MSWRGEFRDSDYAEVLKALKKTKEDSLTYDDYKTVLILKFKVIPDEHLLATSFEQMKKRLNKEKVSVNDFLSFLVLRSNSIRKVFQSIDSNGDGFIEQSELQKASSMFSTPEEAKRVLNRLDEDHSGTVDFAEFFRYAYLAQRVDTEAIFDLLMEQSFDIGDTSYVIDTKTDNQVQLKKKVSPWKVLLAGGVAGAVSRTATAPFDRLKVLLQAGASVGGKEVKGVVSGLRTIYHTGGLISFFRGNGTNVVKIMPESAVKFFSYDLFKNQLVGEKEATVAERFMCGALAGVASQTAVYPLEVAKTRLAVAPPSLYRGLAHCLTSTFSTEGPKGLYKGLLPSLVGIVPYAGVDMSVYFTLRQLWLQSHPQQEPSTALVLLFGATSSFCGQTLSYPLQLVRTRLQAQGLDPAVKYDGMVDCFRQIIRKEGFLGLYRGISPNFLKAIPAISISYGVYEKMKKMLDF